ncbi:metallophosphoesterase [Asticcacaulis sp. W401b]|uniref:metallophosphoesterase n=1 Tax=Asticcacaulis sp. W401b TaxID=3388666 RepID=UPI003970C019
MAVLSDIHVDALHMPPERVRRIAEQVRALRPDVILLAGDYVGGHGLEAGPPRAARSRRSTQDNALHEEGLRALDDLNAPLGVYAVMGNHDCWWDCQRVREILADTRIHFLENQAARVIRPGGDVWIAGLEDGQTQRPDFQMATKTIPQGAATIALVHNPGLFDWASNVLPLQISGHSHVGQVRFPLIGAPVRVTRHTEDTADGWTSAGERLLIVTRGLGESGMPVRFGAPPQIMLLTISPGQHSMVKPVATYAPKTKR